MKKFTGICLLIVFTAGAAAAQDSSHMMNKKPKDCVMMKDGKMMVMKSGMTMMLMHDTTLGHGTMVMMDGNVKMKDGSMHMLKEGECVMPNGKVMMDKMSGKM